MYRRQLEKNMAALTACLYELYGNRWDFYKILSELEGIMEEASSERNKSLKENDEAFIKGFEEGKIPWYLDSKTSGMMLYTDLFADNISGLREKIPYIKEMGINYVHLMPLFKAPENENDGGYAVSSYRDVEKKLGTINDLRETAAEFRRNGIHLVIDFVFNHTSNEHEWALKACKGDPEYKDFYYIFADKSEADEWNRTLREIFPSVRRGSFTYVEKAGGWVWTTFNSFQWDLNYSNPKVFLAMCREMLFIANLGIDVLRLDALAFVWKEKGTVCESLPKAHTLIKAFEHVAKIACPSLIFKSEAIVHPDQVVQYIGTDQCALSYNPLQMALFWSSLASRDARLLTLSLKKRWQIPENTAWVNYIRCHDDIGWTFSDEEASSIGINPYLHRKFLNSFYTGRFEGSFALGEPFQENPDTGDCRICGTMASLAGLEEAEQLGNNMYRKMAVARIRMLYGTLLALPGIPLLYAGDEKAMLNDYSYIDDESKKSDSRWVHRIKAEWDDSKMLESQKKIAGTIREMLKVRHSTEEFSGSRIWFYDTQVQEIFAFCRSDRIHVISNFSEKETEFTVYGHSAECTDLLTGKKYPAFRKIKIEPYAVLWLAEN